MRLTISKPYLVTVNYSLSLAKMIAAGNYDYCDPPITADHFPFADTGIAKVNIRLVRVDGRKKTKTLLRLLEGADLRPATLAELLALSATHPNLTSTRAVVALGSTWSHPTESTRYTLSVHSFAGQKRLELFAYDDMWGKQFSFAAVRKWDT